MNEVDNAKNGLLRYYATQQTAQGARLIGFIVALFTLLQTVQYSSQKPLSDMFSTADSILYQIADALCLCPSCIELLKFCLLFLSIMFLVAMIIRIIFRFAVYASAAEKLLLVKESNIDKESEVPIHEQIHNATFNMVAGGKVYWLFTLNWFIPKKEESKNWIGWFLSLIIAFFSSWIILSFLW